MVAESPQNRFDAEADAIARAKSAINNNPTLWNPDSVSHPWNDYEVKKLPDGSHEVSSYFDAKNAFGGTVRTRYRVVVDKDGNVRPK